MKIIISAGNTTRSIEGAFRVCGSFEDLTTLRDELSRALDRGLFSFGWIDIIPNRPRSGPGGPPLPWE